MITLNSEKGIFKIDSWADVESRPGFASDLDPKRATLKEIIGRYIFKDEIRCGLSNCHTAHTKGYIVTTNEGLETNIGKDCGKRYFGIDFEAASRRFDREVTAAEDRQLLASFSFIVEELEERIASLKEGGGQGATWANTNLKLLTTPGNACPNSAIQVLNNLVRSRTRTLHKLRQATKQETEDQEVIQGKSLPRPHYIEQAVGEIMGTEALFPENDLRKLIVLELEQGLSAFKQKDIDALSAAELRYWARWTASVDPTLEKIATALTFAQMLLRQSNLLQICDVLESADDQKQLRKAVAHLP